MFRFIHPVIKMSIDYNKERMYVLCILCIRMREDLIINGIWLCSAFKGPSDVQINSICTHFCNCTDKIRLSPV